VNEKKSSKIIVESYADLRASRHGGLQGYFNIAIYSTLKFLQITEQLNSGIRAFLALSCILKEIRQFERIISFEAF